MEKGPPGDLYYTSLSDELEAKEMSDPHKNNPRQQIKDIHSSFTPLLPLYADNFLLFVFSGAAVPNPHLPINLQAL